MAFLGGFVCGFLYAVFVLVTILVTCSEEG
jgi:hypothetical protein